MAVTHCNDDKQALVLDQQQFLTDTYRHTKDARIGPNAESRKSFSWRRDLFAVERPFRASSNAPLPQQQQQKKNKKKNKVPFFTHRRSEINLCGFPMYGVLRVSVIDKKRTFDAAFDDSSSNALLTQLTVAVDFCRDRFSSNVEPTPDIQQEHAFDDVPFADVATQQRDRLPPIREILLTDYFLRASKLGIQPNILYTHDKTHASVLDTSIAGRVILPAQCRFLWSDMQNVEMLVSEGTKYSFIVLDPPWMNKSVRRKRPYQWSDFDEIQRLPIEDLIDRQQSSLICCWSTNCDRIEEFIKKDLFSKWKCHYLTTWYWLKVTRSGESVLDLNSMDKKSYETLILAYSGDENRFATLKDTSKIICSIPALIHSVKPALHPMFQSLIDFPRPDRDRCLELYARNLLPNFTSLGNEVLKHQSMDLFEEMPVESKN